MLKRPARISPARNPPVSAFGSLSSFPPLRKLPASLYPPSSVATSRLMPGSEQFCSRKAARSAGGRSSTAWKSVLTVSHNFGGMPTATSQLSIQPALGHNPVTLHSHRRNAQHLGGFF